MTGNAAPMIRKLLIPICMTNTMWICTDLTMSPTTSVTTTDYTIIKDSNGSWTQNSDKTITFRVNGIFNKFTG